MKVRIIVVAAACVALIFAECNADAQAEGGETVSVGTSETVRSRDADSNDSIGLSEHEKQIARDTGSDEKLLLLLKRELKPNFGTIVLSDDGFSDRSFFAGGNARTILLEKDRERYKEIVQKYPELQPVVANALRDATDAYSVKSSTIVAESVSNNDGKKRILAIKFVGKGTSLSADDDPRFMVLVKQLALMGYTMIEDGAANGETRVFASKEEARKAFCDYPDNTLAMMLYERSKKQYKAIYPVDAKIDLADIERAKIIVAQSLTADMDDAKLTAVARILTPDISAAEIAASFAFSIPPGASIEKTGDREWLIDRPERCTASTSLCSAIIFKTPLSKFGLVEAQQTAGLKGGISHETLMAKLKYWDAKYGIRILAATTESVQVYFEKLPDDLSLLCTEFYLFCQPIELSDDDQANAAAMRDMAAAFRKSHTMNFGWH